MNRTCGTFLSALRKSDHHREPFDYWLLEDILPKAVCDAIAFRSRLPTTQSSMAVAKPTIRRGLFHVRQPAAVLGLPRSDRRISEPSGRAGHRTNDGGQPDSRPPTHRVLPGRRRVLAGTTRRHSGQALHHACLSHRRAGAARCRHRQRRREPSAQLLTSVPYKWDAGSIFIPGKNTWHGFRKRPIHGVRKSIIINYVAPGWRAVEEQA